MIAFTIVAVMIFVMLIVMCAFKVASDVDDRMEYG